VKSRVTFDALLTDLLNVINVSRREPIFATEAAQGLYNSDDIVIVMMAATVI
jgi:hypothetical protein